MLYSLMDKHMFNYDGKELTMSRKKADKTEAEELLNIWKNSGMYLFICRYIILIFISKV